MMSDPVPKSPANDSDEALGFQKQPMVDWYRPSQLAETGLRAILSSIFGNYSDKREMQAALDSTIELSEIADFSANKPLWIDYVSDMGAGWNPSYSVAYLLGRKKLKVHDSTGGHHDLPRGDILVMGGDQVYPTPSWQEYKNRLTGPYKCSLPYVAENPPALFAIPGNHDWYDGLSSFIKLFCRKGWIGGWKTSQSRSYFAAKLPYNWWLWGIDIQLNADIDKPQIDYFDLMYEKAEAGDQIILCTSEPAWVYKEYQPDDKPWQNLDFFKKRYAVKKKKELHFRLVLTGDMHHYTSFKNTDNPNPDWKITAGGGGAFTHPTHHVPDTLHLGKNTYKKNAAYPNAKSSRKQTWKNLLFPFINFRFGGFFAAVYLLFFWMAATSTGFFIQQASFPHIIAQYSTHEAGTILMLHGKLLLANPALAIFFGLIWFGFFAFADKNRKKNVGPHIFGFLHGLLHVLSILFAVWFTSRLLLYGWSIELLSVPGVLLAIILMTLEGWLLSGFLMGAYLLAATLLLKTHETEAFSSLRGEDYKSFIRFKVSREELTLYPIKIPKACRKWKFNAEVEGESPWYEPGDNLKYELIEDPIVIKSYNSERM